MIFLMDPEFWARVFGIIIIDLTLAGDNALVIALAVRTLPKRQQLVGRIWGTLGAVGLRLAFITIATFLLRIPFLQLVGGVALFGIALSLPIVVWGSGLLATLMNRFVWVIWLGGGILGYVAGEMILKDHGLARLIDHSTPGLGLLPLVPGVIIVALGWWLNSQVGRKKVPGNA